MDIAVLVQAGATVAQLFQAIRQHEMVDPWEDVRACTSLVLDGAVLDPRLRVGEAGIVHGARLWLSGPNDGASLGLPSRDAVDRLVGEVLAVVGLAAGPEAGSSTGLTSGRFTIGRSSSSELRVRDPAMARDHATVEVRAEPSRPVAVSVAPRPGCVVEVDGHRIDGPVDVAEGQPVSMGSTTWSWSTPVDQRPPNVVDGTVVINRAPRVAVDVRTGRTTERGPSISGDLCPPTLERHRVSWVPIVAPLVAGAAMALVAHQPMYLLLTLLSPVVMTAEWWTSWRSARRRHATQVGRFRAKVRDVATEAASTHLAGSTVRRAMAPDGSEVLRRAMERRSSLWERSRHDHDFLHVRLGSVAQRSAPPIVIEPEDAMSDERGSPSVAEQLLAEVQEVLEGARRWSRVPVTVDLRAVGGLAVVGDGTVALPLVRSIVMQLATLHRPADLAIAVHPPSDLGGGSSDEDPWWRWLPHVPEGSTGPWGSPHDGRATVVTKEAGVEVLVIHEGASVDRAALARAVERGGTFVVWWGSDVEGVPRECRTVVMAAPQPSRLGEIRHLDHGETTMGVEIEGLSAERADAGARAMAAVRDVAGGDLDAGIPSEVELFDVADVQAELSADDVVMRWQQRSTASPSARLGRTASGVLEIDLVREGPHVLVAGTSGSGKSELLQTMVASMAMRSSPDALQFLLVDYKGGAAFGEAAALPHVAGMVTDLDAHLSRRALQSLRAELRRREALLAGRAKDVETLWRSAPEVAPPRLVVVIDEFATLVHEVPDFVPGVIDIARRGRSLGVHLVLATQRPAGAVSDEILANVSTRIALRTVDAADSCSVLGVADAAKITSGQRGRAVLRTGLGDPVHFQVAHAGAPVTSEPACPVQVVPAPGLASLVDGCPGPSRSSEVAPEHTTQMAHVVEVVDRAAASSGWLTRDHPRPWCEPLPEVIAFDDLPPVRPVDRDGGEGWPLVLGMVDLPSQQSQDPWSVDLGREGNLMVRGPAGGGKTTTLCAVAHAAAATGSPSEVWVYGIDAAGRGLDGLRHHGHCGDVVAIDDLERVSRLLSNLTAMLEERSSAFAELAVASFAEAGGRWAGSLPRVVLLIDDLPTVQARLHALRLGTSPKNGADWFDDLACLMATGRAYGIHVVSTAPIERSPAPSMMVGTGATLHLRSFDGVSVVATMPPGRGTVAGREVQVAWARPASSRRDGPTRAPSGSASLRMRLLGSAPPIDRMSSSLRADDLRVGAPVRGSRRVAVGVRDRDLGEHEVDITHRHLVVAGPRGSGRTNALVLVARGLRQCAVPVWRLGSQDQELATMVDWDRCFDDAEVLAVHLATSSIDRPGVSPPVLFVDDADLASPWPALDDVARSLAPGSPRLVLSCAVPALRTTYGVPSWVGEVVRGGNGLILGPDTGEGSALGAPSTFFDVRPGLTFPPGRGFAVSGRSGELVQLALAEIHDRRSDEGEAGVVAVVP